jgi:hypothetical protein
MLTVIVLVLAAVVIVVVGHRPGHAPASGGQRIAAETGIRNEVAAWVQDQVGPEVDIACDAAMCADLAQHGFPAADLNVLHLTAPDPYGSQLVMATADIRSQFGSKLASVYAPQVIASFGTGADKIVVRVIAARGPAAFRAEIAADLQARKSSGAELVNSSRLTTSIAARAELVTGQVDLRLITTLAFISQQEPLSIAGFGTYSPAAGPDVPLRTAYLATADPAAKVTGAAYLTALTKALHAQIPPYIPLTVTTADYAGQQVLEIVFSAPSPLGLLKS